MGHSELKGLIANQLDKLYILDRLFEGLNGKYKNNYIRAVNYHDTKEADLQPFEKQLEWFVDNFENVSKEGLTLFLNGQREYHCKPGLILTFDDGYEGNYLYAAEVIEKYGFTGYFMCSVDLIGQSGYMTAEQIRDLIRRGHIIGCHTATHHRMEKGDDDGVLEYEIHEAKETLERIIGGETIDFFCWCGGEEEHYTREAYNKIKASGYRYSFMTNSFPILPGNDAYSLQRINIEAGWELELVKFQVCGLMDWKLRRKRKRVSFMIQGENR